MKETLDWEKLPKGLRYLSGPAEKYGHYQFEDRIRDFYDTMTDDQNAELIRLLARVQSDEEAIDIWLDGCSMTEHPEARLVYFLLQLLAYGNDADLLGPRVAPPPWNTVENHIKTLGETGSYRLASLRAHAAMFLADFGEKGRPAIPALTRALQDEDLRVRVWAHFALAVIEGEFERHEAAVRQIYSQHDQKDALGCHDDVGGEAAAALERFAEWRKKNGKPR